MSDENLSPVAQDNSQEPGLFRRIVKRFMQFIVVIAILAGGGIAALMINDIEPPKPSGGHDHGHGGGHDHHAEKEGGGEHDGHNHGGHEHGHGGSGHDEEAEGREVAFNAITFANAGLKVETAKDEILHPRLSLNGIITPNEEQVVQIIPRFPGVVRQIHKRLGSKVRRGEILVTIESDESLKAYSVRSAINGTVIARNVGLGEHVDRSNKMMVVADLGSVWVDFRVYLRDFKKLKINQDIEVSSLVGNSVTKAKIAYISPIGMSDTQSMMARAIVPNPHGNFRPGLFVKGRALLGNVPAFVAVREKAIQYIEGKPVVFVEKEGSKGKSFVAKNVELGPGDGTFREIYFGVTPGQKYVSGNSFTLKAELSKGNAAHSH